MSRIGELGHRVRETLSDLRWRRRHMPAQYARPWRMTIADWLIFYYRDVLSTDAHWMGVRSLKNPLDAWVYQEIIYETRPEVILELGSAYGGSALYFAHLLDLLGDEGRVVSVDHSHEAFRAQHPRISTVTGDTRDPAVIESVRELCESRRVMMIHDASHDAPVVLEDLRSYSPLVTPGCYLIVEDGVGDLISPAKGGRSSPGPFAAVRDFLRESPQFELDAHRERHIATYSPHGFLRRRTSP